MAQVHRIVDSIIGEICLKPIKDGSEVYIGDNYDEWIGDIDCTINAPIDEINRQIKQFAY